MHVKMSGKNHWVSEQAGVHSNCFKRKEFLWGFNRWRHVNSFKSKQIQHYFRGWRNYDIHHWDADCSWRNCVFLDFNHIQGINQKQHDGTNFHVDCGRPGIFCDCKSLHVCLLSIDGHSFGLFHCWWNQSKRKVWKGFICSSWIDRIDGQMNWFDWLNIDYSSFKLSSKIKIRFGGFFIFIGIFIIKS